MRIVHVIIDLNVGGAELMLNRLIKHTSGDNVEHIVISLTDTGTLGPEIINQGILVKCLNIKSPAQYVIGLWRLIKLFKELRPDIVHTWMYHSDLLGGIAAKIAGIKKIIWCVRSTDISKGGSKFTLLIRWVCAKISSLIPDVIVYAANASKLVHEKCGYSEEKSLVIHNGFDLTYLDRKSFCNVDLRTEFNIPENEIIISSIGRFSPVKDHKSFISAALLIAENHANVRFLLIGRGLDVQNEFLMQLINDSPYADKFILVGERKDIPACLLASDIFCLHSVTEGFPNVLGEAMAMGIPSVTTDVGDAAILLGMPDYVVAPGHPRLLANSMGKLLSLSHSERKDIGTILRRRIELNFSMDTVAHKFLSLYEY